MARLTSGWGIGPWGSVPWGAGVAEGFEILAVQPIRENVVRIRFSVPVYFSGLLDPGDASVLSRYVIQAISGTYGIEGDEVRIVHVVSVAIAPTDGTEIDLTVDRPFTSFGARYLVAVNGLQSVDGEPISPSGSVFEFDGLYRELVPPVVDRVVSNRDLANPQSFASVIDPLPVTTDPDVLGTFPVDDQGDYAFDEGMPSLKKRIFRRVYTRKNAFAHLPGYGSLVPQNVKRLAQSGTRDLIAADLEEQILSEPEVVSVNVSIVSNPDGVTYARVHARTNFGTQTLNVPLTVGA